MPVNPMSTFPPLVVIVGATASGKSALAMEVARQWDGEIIAADSRTVYKGMDIGTAKPTAEDQAHVRHHLLDIRNPDEHFSAAEFKQLAETAIKNISGRGKLPILVGGTGLYVDAILYDYQFGPAADMQKRAYLDTLSVEVLQEMCRQRAIALPVNKNNRRHLIRALELGGLRNDLKKLRASTLIVGITTKRERLRERIAARAHNMIEKGIVGEVEAVGKKYNWHGEALKGNIYRIFRDVVEGKMSLGEATEASIRSDMALAKRQMTWFKRNSDIVWSENPEELLGKVGIFLHQQHL